MRRDGKKFGTRSNQTFRSNECVIARRKTGFGSNNCSYHSRFSHEDAYVYLCEQTGDTRVSEEAVTKQKEVWEQTKGCCRSRYRACVVGRAARAMRRYCWSCGKRELVTKHQKKVELRHDVTLDLQCAFYEDIRRSGGKA